MTSRNPRKKPAPPAREPAPAPVFAPVDPRLRLLLAMAALAAALPVAASFFPGARLWGFNHLAFVHPALRWGAVAILALAFIPPLARWAWLSLLRVGARAGSERNAWLTPALVAAACVVVFHTFSSSTLLLGDGQLIVRSFEAAEEGHDQVVMRSPRAIVTEELIAPGTTLLYYAAANTATDRFKRTPLDGMRALNCILGGVFVFLLLRVATARTMTPEQRVWLVLLALFTCSIELFFGYIENYTTPWLLLALYVVTAWRALLGRGPAWVPLLPLAAAIYAHVQSVLFVPSFFFVLMWRFGTHQRDTLLRRWTPIYACVAVVGVLAGSLIPQLKRFYVPFGASNEAYGLFAPHHLADVANEILMLLPILPVVLALAWVTRGTPEPRPTKEPTWFTLRAEWLLAVTILIPCALYVLFFHPEIGMARDWDLFTMSTLALVPMVVILFGRYLRATGIDSARAACFAVPALAVTMVTGVAWVAVNHSEPRTVSRFEHILAYDATHASYAWENLALLQHERGDLEAAIATMRTATDHSRNPRQYVRLAVYLEEAGRVDEAMKVLEDVLTRRPEYTKARFRVLLFLEKQGNWARLKDVARGGVEHNPDEPIYRFFYGESLIRLGDKEAGLDVFESCRGMDLPSEARKYIEETLLANGRGTK